MGSIYKITCAPTGLSYIGQTCDKKYRNGKAYNYGPSGRWSDHVSSARKSSTPLAEAIREYGRENFTIEVLESAELEKLDELEAKWIASCNTLTPNGLNVARHGRNKHHNSTTLAEHYKGQAVHGCIRPIRSNGELSLVYLNLTLSDGVQQRICFGQNREHTFETAMRDAKQFVKIIGCPWTSEDSEELQIRFSKQLAQLKDRKISHVRITTASGLVAVYVATEDMASYKEQVRACFGGKTISRDNAYEKAMEYIKLLNIPEDIVIQDLIHKSSQQATA